MIRRARLKAFAKLNLGLRVLYKRPDGYHELRTVFQTISLADRITVFIRTRVEARIEIEGAPEIEDNLLTRAAARVLEELRCAVVFISTSKRPFQWARASAAARAMPRRYCLRFPFWPAGRSKPSGREPLPSISAAMFLFFFTAGRRSPWGEAKNFTLCPNCVRPAY